MVIEPLDPVDPEVPLELEVAPEPDPDPDVVVALDPELVLAPELVLDEPLLGPVVEVPLLLLLHPAAKRKNEIKARFVI
jgi:hypothetical protein